MHASASFFAHERWRLSQADILYVGHHKLPQPRLAHQMPAKKNKGVFLPSEWVGPASVTVGFSGVARRDPFYHCLWRRPPTRPARGAMIRGSIILRRCAVSASSHRYELECLRMAADCAQLASDVHNRAREANFLASDLYNCALEVHFLRMAKIWTARAERGPDGHFDEQIPLSSFSGPHIATTSR